MREYKENSVTRPINEILKKYLVRDDAIVANYA